MTPARRHVGLTAEGIVAAAVEVLDAEGLEALTMPRLGTRLGVAQDSLHRYFPTRQALLAEVAGSLSAEAVIDDAPDVAWPEALTAFGVAYRRMVLHHPRAVPLLATHPATVDLGLLSRFEAAGIASQDALAAVQSVRAYVLGHALVQVQDESALAFYDQSFDSGLIAMVTGFERQLV